MYLLCMPLAFPKFNWGREVRGIKYFLFYAGARLALYKTQVDNVGKERR